VRARRWRPRRRWAARARRRAPPAAPCWRATPGPSPDARPSSTRLAGGARGSGGGRPRVAGGAGARRCRARGGAPRGDAGERALLRRTAGGAPGCRGRRGRPGTARGPSWHRTRLGWHRRTRPRARPATRRGPRPVSSPPQVAPRRARTLLEPRARLADGVDNMESSAAAILAEREDVRATWSRSGARSRRRGRSASRRAGAARGHGAGLGRPPRCNGRRGCPRPHR